MASKPKEVERDEQSFHSLLVGLRGFFVTDDALRRIYRKLYFKGADLKYINSLVICLRASDSTHDMCRELGAKRRDPTNNITKGELRETWTGLSYFAADCLVPESDGTKQSFTPRQKEDLGGFLLENYATNPEDYRSGGKSDRCGSFFLLLITEHLKEKRVKPRDSLAARLLRTTRRLQSEPAALEAARVKKRVHKFKLETHDWQWRIQHFTEKFRYLSTT